MISKYILATILSLAVLCQWSCVREDCDIIPDSEGSAEVSIEIRIPGKPYPVDTRALSEADETHVEDVIILVFDSNGNFLQRADARTVQPTSEENVKRFSIKLKTGQCDIWLLANCKSIIDAYTFPANATKTTLRENLLLQVGSKWNTGSAFTPLPMWGERTGLNVTPGLSLVGASNRIQLIRSVVKVDVTIDRTQLPEADFTMQALNFHNWSNRSRVIPDDAAFGTDKTVVERISGGTESPVTAKVQSFAATDRDTDGFFTNVIYLPETPPGTATGTTNPCIVVNATYEGTSGWHKAEFLDEDVSGDLDRFLPLLRNHRYNFQIIGVEGRGYATADEALKSAASNLILKVHTQDDTSLTNVMYDGQYWLAWDPDKFEFYREEHPADDTDNVMQIETNCENGWKFERVVDSSGQPVTWLTIPAAEQSGPKNTRGQVHFVTSENTGAPRTAFVHFSAGRMDMAVEVTQSDVNDMAIRFFDIDDVEITGDTLWVNTIEKKIQERMLRVKWTPEGGTLSVAVSQAADPEANVIYESGGDIAVGTVPGDGEHGYPLKFSELDDDRDVLIDSDGSPAGIRAYRNKYTFTLSYHGKEITKDITIAHHLETFKYTFYQPQGYFLGLHHYAPSSYLGFIVSTPITATYSDEHDLLDLVPAFNYNGNVPPGGMATNYWQVRMKNPTPLRKTLHETIKVSFPDSELPDTTVIIKPFLEHPNCYIVRPGDNVQVPVSKPWAITHPHYYGTFSYTPPPTTGTFSCELLWEDVQGLIRNVDFTPAFPFDPYRTEMTVETNSGLDEGNAVIALRRNGTIIWSWHIWVTTYDPESTPPRVYNPDHPGRVFMDRNLGATSNNNNGTLNRQRSQGLFYQWGRKDPFPHMEIFRTDGATYWYGLDNHKNVYNNNGQTYFNTAPRSETSAEASLEYSIANPMTFITAGQPENYDWHYDQNEVFRWSAGQVYTQSDWGDFKGRHDPCPEGWMVPGVAYHAVQETQIWGDVTAIGGLFFPSQNLTIFQNDYGVVTSFGEFYPACGYINAIGRYTNSGVEFCLTTIDPNYQTGIIQVIGPRLGRVNSGYIGSDLASGLNVRCMKATYQYKPEND